MTTKRRLRNWYVAADAFSGRCGGSEGGFKSKI